MKALIYTVFLLLLGLATIYLDMIDHPSAKRQMLADILGALWLFLLAFGMTGENKI